MPKQEESNNQEDSAEETPEQREMSEALRKIGEENSENKNSEKSVSRRGFLGSILKAAAGVAIGSSVLGEVAKGEGNNAEGEKNIENIEANKLLKNLFELPDNPKYNLEDQRGRAQNHLEKMKVAEIKIQRFALQRKLSFPEKKNIYGNVSPDDMKETLGVLETNLNAAIDTRFRRAQEKDKNISIEDVKKEIYSHPGIEKLHSMIEINKD